MSIIISASCIGLKPKPLYGQLNVYGTIVDVEWKSYDAFLKFQNASLKSRDMILARGYGVTILDDLPKPIEDMKEDMRLEAAARRKKKSSGTGRPGRPKQVNMFSKARGIPVASLKEASAEA